jgi:CBS domain-containing protein
MLIEKLSHFALRKETDMLTTVRDLLKVKGDALFVVQPDTPIIDAIKMLAEKRIGDLLVLEDDQITGILSERDIVRRIAAENTYQHETPVSVYMTTEVFTIHPSQTIEDCMRLMTEKRIRHLPVVEDGQPIGMISIGDVIKAIISSQEFTIDQLQKYISGGGYNQ